MSHQSYPGVIAPGTVSLGFVPSSLFASTQKVAPSIPDSENGPLLHARRRILGFGVAGKKLWLPPLIPAGNIKFTCLLDSLMATMTCIESWNVLVRAIHSRNMPKIEGRGMLKWSDVIGSMFCFLVQ